MTEDTLIHVKPAIAASAHVNAEAYRLMQNHAAKRSRAFLGGAGQAHRLDKPPRPTSRTRSFDGDVRSNGSRTAC